MKSRKILKMAAVIFAVAAVGGVIFAVNSGLNMAVLREELAAATEVISRLSEENVQMSLEVEILQAELAEVRKTSILAEETPHEEDVYFHMRQSAYENAAAILREIVGEDVIISPMEDFVVLPDWRIWVSGEWETGVAAFTRPATIEAIFSYWGDRGLQLETYTPFGYAGTWRPYLQTWQNFGLWRRSHEHALESVPVRFYSLFWGDVGEEMRYTTEYLDGESFSERLAQYAEKHLNRRIIDAWFTQNGRVLYVNLHTLEPRRMSSGTTGEMEMYLSLLHTLASVPNIEMFVILVDGRSESWVGGHSGSFRDIYFVDDLAFPSGW
ncbi:MAG: hypothetical protein FWG65_03415 [Turicibacter sp.]|nr:hypothetical protein [Turicibacter sp.]